MNRNWVQSGLALIIVLLGTAGGARDTLKLNIVSYQAPPGLTQYLNEAAPDGVSYNDSKWVGVSDADVIIFFMSNSNATHEIPALGSQILDTVEVDPDRSAVVTQSIAIEDADRVVFAVFVFADMLGDSVNEMKCNTANAIAALNVQVSSNQVAELRYC